MWSIKFLRSLQAPREGEEFWLALKPLSPQQHGHTGPNGLRGLGLQPGSLVGRDGGMDSLFVEEVAASLVREFLSRKRCPLKSATFRTGETTFPRSLCVTVIRHFRKAGLLPGLPAAFPGICSPGRAAAQGLKRTGVTMDQERPRSDLSINSRNDLRKVLHLEFLYKENKAKENPLKTSLELMTRYFLDHFGNAANNFTQETPIPALSVPKKNNKLPLKCSETTLVNIYDLSDEDAGWRTSLSETSRARQENLDGDVLGNFVSSKRPPHKSKPVQVVSGESPHLASVWEKMEKRHSPEPSLEVKRVGEKTRPKSGLIVRGMMAGPTASSPQDSLRKRALRRPPTLSSATQPQEEGRKMPELLAHTPACPALQEGLASSTSSASRSPPGQLSELTADKRKTLPRSPPHLLSKGLPRRERGSSRELSEGSPAADSSTDADRTLSNLYLPGGNSRVTQERLERAFKRQGSQPPPRAPGSFHGSSQGPFFAHPAAEILMDFTAGAQDACRKHPLPESDNGDHELGALRLEDVEDELIREEVTLGPGPSVRKLQVTSQPIDLSVAKEIKTLLFGSSLCCFNEEWKLQSFSFNDTASLKYGIVQNKAGCSDVSQGPFCWVLMHNGGDTAQIWGVPVGFWQLSKAASYKNSCLKEIAKLTMLGKRGRGDIKPTARIYKWTCKGQGRRLQPSDVHRTRCLALAIADIVWRAGGRKKAVVALCPGVVTLRKPLSLAASSPRHVSNPEALEGSPMGDQLLLHTVTCYDELVAFLQQSVQQFEAGPYGCILLTLSAILSRSTELVRQDFDVPTNHLIGAHGYCTQELVNLLLTGKAVSNVFNDVVELDSGNGNITLLRGIAARSDIGFLSLFEHYDVCQVGCFLKTPRFPIWVVCSESHFSVLFSLRPELLCDWRTERLFDLYYYDGLANQQEQIRLTIDTTQTIPENKEDDLIPPLELCIRTNARTPVVLRVEGGNGELEWLRTHPVISWDRNSPVDVPLITGENSRTQAHVSEKSVTST
ncbi:Protein FAM188B [Tupaia chinensis]|uniref:Ubiquitin carboxyl-terminal hydrolase MINDY n=1 Tax=Tupaia chinensis TaxID=246437 RepID=L9KYB2_TUPCH|nr:Protein FAM188B [Tupaia chinensis]